MAADPVPHDSIFLHDGQSAIFKADANRACRIALEETSGALVVPLSAGE